MAKIYLRMIHNEKMTIEDVPEYWRAQVQTLLDEEKKAEEEAHAGE